MRRPSDNSATSTPTGPNPRGGEEARCWSGSPTAAARRRRRSSRPPGRWSPWNQGRTERRFWEAEPSVEPPDRSRPPAPRTPTRWARANRAPPGNPEAEVGRSSCRASTTRTRRGWSSSLSGAASSVREILAELLRDASAQATLIRRSTRPRRAHPEGAQRPRAGRRRRGTRSPSACRRGRSPPGGHRRKLFTTRCSSGRRSSGVAALDHGGPVALPAEITDLRVGAEDRLPAATAWHRPASGRRAATSSPSPAPPSPPATVRGRASAPTR